jgi:hypothetical protein
MAYNPGNSYRGSDYLFSGLQQGGSVLAEGIQTWKKNKEESQFLDQQAAEIAKMIAPQARQMEQSGQVTPEDKAILDDLAKFPGLSLGAKRGKLSGIMFGVQQRAQQAQAQAEGQRHQDRMGIDRANVELRRGELMAGDLKDRRQTDAASARDRDTLAWLTALANPEANKNPANLQQQFPNADADIIAKMIGESGNRNRVPESTKIGGRDVVFSPHTGAFQIVPTGPQDGELQAQPVTDEAGNILGYGIPSGRGGITFRPRAADRPPDGTPVPGLETTHVYVNGKAVKRDAAGELLQKVGGNGASAATTPPANRDPLGLGLNK